MIGRIFLLLHVGIIALSWPTGTHGFMTRPIREETRIPSALRAAAKRSKKKGASTASSTRGFGTKPLSFEQVVAQFPTRLPPNALDLPCPCQKHSNPRQPEAEGTDLITYRECCAPYHDGEKLPESPERVLRSRYSAFRYRNIPYILKTTHPDCSDYQSDKIKWAKDMNKGGMFDGYDFVGLEILSDTVYSDENSAEAFLEFQVRLAKRNDSPITKSTDVTSDAEEVIVAEKSRFLKASKETTETSPTRANDSEEGPAVPTSGWLYVSGDIVMK